MIAWRFIITDFYQLHYDTELPPFDEARAYTIYARTLERYTTLVMATAHKIRAIIHARERSGASHPQRLLNRSNRTIGPLFSLDALLRPTEAGLGACTRIFRHSAQPRKHLPSRTPIFPVAASPYFERGVRCGGLG
eukprot:scaffold18700_cov132-Isochrysis_galbana.AAC.5